ncbi:hypothetical protein BABINDRAFT_39224 [Babjeviella inositovora NRRL Y-12698]|uniref:Vps72/YL1 C-terminal domain-containing protein n=1 Tax=Babjeviella inositovora NRRL Y-12698 TaxID=984486 RepID=A0A1E3QL08_9ASCO|nr:uncharacterized protein BABINDRAFT_39224 [Babjeviella inositovora NRRL Y-12698]ODQ78389.1 hypothetical protein BABINDRAFT_39224 [Babjeviella inositovora NRRL Y-12698]
MPDMNEISYLTTKPHSFKSPTWKAPNRRHKPLKQLLSDEQKRLNTHEPPLANDPVTYFSVEAPPSLRPLKVYCDITGLPTTYKAPGSNLRYYDAEVFELIRNIAPGVDQQYLELRAANVILR